MLAILRELQRRQAVGVLVPYLTSASPGVRLWAGSRLLSCLPAQAEPVLLGLSHEASLVGFSAAKVLREWRAGRLGP